MAVELADRLAELTPGDCNRDLLHHRRLRGGGVGVEAGPPVLPGHRPARRLKVISRNIAYHGATMGALSITGVTEIKTPFEPLVPGAIKVPNTNFYRAPYFADDLEAFGRWAADAIEQAILIEGPGHGGRRVPRAGPERRRVLSAASRATSNGCGRSATATACCSSPTRSSAPSAGSGTGSGPSATTTSRTWSPWPRD